MLLALINFFKEREIISLSELLKYFDIQQSALMEMLSLLERKGYIKKINVNCNNCISNCNTCPFLKDKDYYQYIKKGIESPVN